MKILNYIFIVILLVVSSTINADSAKKIQNAINNADYQLAADLIDEAISNDPENKQLLLQKGFLLIQKGKFQQAVDHYKNVLGKFENDQQVLTILAIALRLNKEYQSSIDLLIDTKKQYPNFIEPYVHLGDTYISLAYEEYAKGLTKSPDNEQLKFRDKLLKNMQKDMATYVKSKSSALADNSSTKSATKNQTSKVEKIADAKKVKIKTNPEELNRFLSSWSKDWKNKHVEKYFNHYADSFKPGKSRSISQWKKHKQRIFSKAKSINVEISDIELDVQDDTNALVKFTQLYKSDTFEETIRKSLSLIKENNKWLITSEKQIN